MSNHLFLLSQLLKYAFMSGRGLADFDKISDADQSAWMEFDCTETQAFRKITQALTVEARAKLLEKHLRSMADEVRACLDCKAFEWSPDQWDAADIMEKDARKALSDTHETIANLLNVTFAAVRTNDEPLQRVRHKASGKEYEVLGVGRTQCRLLEDLDEVVIYRGTDGKLWARDKDEFYDGRFENVVAEER